MRGFVSTTVAPGGTGKSSLALVEALAIATGRNLLGVTPQERTAVWLWNGEDPADELQRRVMAACLHFGIGPEELEGRLFVDSGRSMPMVVAARSREGAKVEEGAISQIIATIREKRIGVLVIDPFVACHRVSENDNAEIDLVAKAWARIADETGAAVELIHHVRKGNGAEVTVEDGRGAIALLNAARSGRAINRMTADEAVRFGIEQPRGFFHAVHGKANLAPPSEVRAWFRLVSVDLGNATAERPGDSVGVVVTWEPPKALDCITLSHLDTVRARVRSEGHWREDPQSRDWIGHLVSEVAGLDLERPADKATVKAALATWFRNGAFGVEKRPDSSRRLRAFITAPPFRD